MRTIVWDVDDVLNDLMRCWFKHYWIPSHPHSPLTYEDLTENPPHKILGIKLKEYLDSLDMFRLSKKAEEMEPIPEVMSWFRKYGERFRHIAITARPLNTIPAISSWVFRHFGFWIRGFHFIPAFREGQHIPEYERRKNEYLLRLGEVNVFVDDDPVNIHQAEEIGLKGVLIPRPWNKNKLTIEEVLDLLLRI